MSFKFSFLILSLFVTIYISYVDAEESNKRENRKCVVGKSYHDGCNNCFCANNLQNEDGTYEAVIGCTQMACFSEISPEGMKEVETQPPPEDFWQPE